jgi:four helix bundle protein
MEFAFKELNVWRKAIDFVGSVLSITEELSNKNRHYRIIEQLEGAALSVSNNIAEGKGRNSKKEFIHYLYIARGSLYEAISILNVLEHQQLITNDDFTRLETDAVEIVKMIKGLINSISR